MKDARVHTGKSGEARAAHYLEAQGFSLVAQNWRTRSGEIDIIAFCKNTLVFVEVKTLPHGNAEMLAHVLGSAKQKRIVEISKCFLAINRQYSKSYIRYDVIVIDMPGFPEVYHIENAFSELL
ncbi:MAG: YraN family protein [Treponema sp.]|nr:YraN family protein [Treponema sp.]